MLILKIQLTNLQEMVGKLRAPLVMDMVIFQKLYWNEIRTDNMFEIFLKNKIKLMIFVLISILLTVIGLVINFL